MKKNIKSGGAKTYVGPPTSESGGAMAPWLPPLPTPLNFTYLHIGLEERQASLIKIISHGLINRNKISRYLI